ncbi:MAG TPA: response regulator [Ramlibacter sp.]|jgi:DNA-binding response OmpR family regulator|nr:response regulator [Ramlibacter sp.]
MTRALKPVVVVDNDVHLRRLLRDFLADIGFEATFFDDGYAALDAARRARPDLVITEVLVPRLGGLSLVRLIKSDAELARTRVLVLSSVSAQARALESGADAFLQKPLERSALVSAVTAIVAAPPGGEH